VEVSALKVQKAKIVTSQQQQKLNWIKLVDFGIYSQSTLSVLSFFLLF
jgi:hypothetical protein